MDDYSRDTADTGLEIIKECFEGVETMGQLQQQFYQREHAEKGVIAGIYFGVNEIDGTDGKERCQSIGE
jgi:hypothetical protein